MFCIGSIKPPPVQVHPSLLPTTPQASFSPLSMFQSSNLPPYNYSSLYPQPQAPVSYSPSYSSQPLFPAPRPLYSPPVPGYVPNQPYYSSIRMQQPFNPQHINPVLYPLYNTTERMEYSQPSAVSVKYSYIIHIKSWAAIIYMYVKLGTTHNNFSVIELNPTFQSFIA